MGGRHCGLALKPLLEGRAHVALYRGAAQPFFNATRGAPLRQILRVLRRGNRVGWGRIGSVDDLNHLVVRFELIGDNLWAAPAHFGALLPEPSTKRSYRAFWQVIGDGFEQNDAANRELTLLILEVRAFSGAAG